MFIFQSARIRLSFWYVLIIAVISTSFSALIYRDISWELERGFRMAEHRLVGSRYNNLAQLVILEEELIEAKKILLFRLLMINGIILVISGVSSYFLAGKTLAPIEEMLEDQKRFVDDASHELRTPLTTLRSEIEVAIRDKNISARETKSLMKSNLEEVVKMQSLINYLLSLSRYQRNKEDIKKEKVELSSVIESVIEKLSKKAEKKNITISRSLKEVYAYVHAVSIEELISILVDNSIKYTPEKGKISVSVKKKGRGAVIEVSDNGVGISRKDLPHIFDRFYRADLSRCKETEDGYGLGLSIAKTIVEAHKAEIFVKSKLKSGTTFTVIIP